MSRLRQPKGSANQVTGTMPSQSDVKGFVEVAIDKMEEKIKTLLSEEIHELKEVFQAEFEKLNKRIEDLEKHVGNRDEELESTQKELKEAKSTIIELSDRVENAEMNSRLPCLILSGRSMAPSRAAVPPAGRNPAAAASRDSAPADGRNAVAMTTLVLAHVTKRPAVPR